eukprot:363781-Chlamydomonas_euryale.AAC.2
MTTVEGYCRPVCRTCMECVGSMHGNCGERAWSVWRTCTGTVENVHGACGGHARNGAAWCMVRCGGGEREKEASLSGLRPDAVECFQHGSTPAREACDLCCGQACRLVLGCESGGGGGMQSTGCTRESASRVVVTRSQGEIQGVDTGMRASASRAGRM